ncbi:hypothetical protein CEXT_419551 [Caerostris extrusa]|uniref:Secreted protein n=1 Tax=Caerostris extrusa TaxID=172846 RepID=A0AAV4V727_CAEEX|nr:hypothetical protein CEXT_419551 [Caerostris extrusa]
MQRNICFIILLFVQDVKSQLTQSQLIQNFDQATDCTPGQALPQGPVTAISPLVLAQYYSLMMHSMRFPKCLVHRDKSSLTYLMRKLTACAFLDCVVVVKTYAIGNPSIKWRATTKWDWRGQGYGAPGGGRQGGARGGYPEQQPETPVNLERGKDHLEDLVPKENQNRKTVMRTAQKTSMKH